MAWLTKTEIENLGFASVGNPVFLSNKASFYNCEKIRLGHHVRIDDFCILSAGFGGIEIGNYVHLAVYCELQGEGKIYMADFSGLSARVSIYSDYEHCKGEMLAYSNLSEDDFAGKCGDVILHSQSGAGAGSVILPNVTLEYGSGCPTSTVIIENCKAFSGYFGVPARWATERKKTMLQLEQQLREKLARDE